MGSEHDDWLKGIGIEAGWGGGSITKKDTPEGLCFTIKFEKGFSIYQRNFTVWVIPCYTKGDGKVGVEGSLTVDRKNWTLKGAVTAKVGGALELGVGATSKEATGGPYGAAELTSSGRVSATFDKNEYERAGGELSRIDKFLKTEPLTLSVTACGKIGIKIEIEGAPKLGADVDIVDWELIVVTIGPYVNGQFEYFRVAPGKDVDRLVGALQNAAKAVEKWVAESKEAGAVADATGKALDVVKKATGVDAGSAVEEAVRDLLYPGGETSEEATERVNKEMEAFNASQEDLHAVIKASGLEGELRPFRTVDEYNLIIECWRIEMDIVAKGGSEIGKWRTMVEDLVRVARERKAKQGKGGGTGQKGAAAAPADPALEAAIATAVGTMEAARPGAQGQGNVLNNRLTASPNAAAKSFFDQGWQSWAAAEAARGEVAKLQGLPKADKAREAAALYAKAKETFTAGIQQL